jgi:hypothetical protein
MNITSRYHNHDAEDDLSGHSQARVMTEEERATITTLATSSITTKKIMSEDRCSTTELPGQLTDSPQ